MHYSTEYQSQSHTVWTCLYHVVITPKYRKKIPYSTIRKRTGEILRLLAKQKGIEIVEGNAAIDHIHMMISIPPKFSIANTIGFLKGKSAIKLHFEFSKNRHTLAQKSFWSRGYFVSTVGRDEETIRKYIQDQWKHDKSLEGNQLDLFWN